MVVMKYCDDSDNQKWSLRGEGGLVQHNKIHLCLDSMQVQTQGIIADRCNSALETQRWKFVNKFTWDDDDGDDADVDTDLNNYSMNLKDSV